MSGADIYDQIVSNGPGRCVRRSASELRALVLKAAIGAGLPLGHAEELAGIASDLARDPVEFASLAVVLEGPHMTPKVEGHDDGLHLTGARTAMMGSIAIDLCICEDRDVILPAPNAAVIRALVAQAARAYRLDLNATWRDAAQVDMIVSLGGDSPSSRPDMAPQAVPKNVLDHLAELASKTYVPASDASRVAGAGAGLSDND